MISPSYNAGRTSGSNPPVWSTVKPLLVQPELVDDSTSEVCIVGAGIAGLTTAYLLLRSGYQVLVVDDGLIGSGESGRTTAHLSYTLDDRFQDLEKMHGLEMVRLATKSHLDAINLIEEIVQTEDIDCDFERVSGYLFLDPKHDIDFLRAELAAAQRCGLPSVVWQEEAPDTHFKIGPSLKFPQQGQFHIQKYLNGLAAAIRRRGGDIHSHTRITHFDDNSDSVTLHTANGAIITVQQAVIATNHPIQCPARIYSGQVGYRTFVVAFKLPHRTVAHNLYWDTADPYHYVRIVENGAQDWLIVGGEDQRTGEVTNAVKHYQALEQWARQLCPQAGAVGYHWSGQVMEPADGLAMIGLYPHSKRAYLITGDSGMGMTHGTIGAQLIVDLMTERPNPLSVLYNPKRIITKPLGEVVTENIDTATHFVKDKLANSPVTSMAEIPDNSGAVIGDGPNKQAVYRDVDGTLHRYSAKCTHLGCIVSWNDDEKTWDCPCHSSSFDRYGKQVHGPASTDLEELTD